MQVNIKLWNMCCRFIRLSLPLVESYGFGYVFFSFGYFVNIELDYRNIFCVIKVCGEVTYCSWYFVKVKKKCWKFSEKGFICSEVILKDFLYIMKWHINVLNKRNLLKGCIIYDSVY